MFKPVHALTLGKKFLMAAAATVLATAAIHAHAQSGFPNKPVRVVIPFPPGGALDTLMRTIAPEVSNQLGQQVVILNKPGGGSQLAAVEITSTPADGYTIFMGQVGDFAVNPLIYKKINYIPSRDFTGVALLVRSPQVMLGNSGGKISSVKALKDVLAGGVDINYGSFGPGTAPHLLGHMLSKTNPSSKFTHIPYKGFPPAMQGFLGGEVDLLFDAIPGAMNMMKGGKVVPLAVAAAQRSPHLPNVPTTTEIGFPSMQMEFWIAIAVKKGTPDAIVTRLHDAFEKAITSPDNWKRFSELGYTRTPMSPEQVNALIQAETDKHRPLIAETGVSVD